MTYGQEIKDEIRNLFVSRKLAVLSTHQNGQPYASLVAFAGRESLKEIFFITSRTTRKFLNLSADPRVAILINSSSNMESDFHKAVSVTAMGTAGEINGPEKDQILVQFLAKHPYLESFATSPTCALVGIAVTQYVLVKNFQQVMELHVD